MGEIVFKEDEGKRQGLGVKEKEMGGRLQREN